MKNYIKISSVIIGILLVLTVLCISMHKTSKTQDDIADLLRKELQLAVDDCTIISCVGEFLIDEDPSQGIYENALLWFSFQNQGLTYYRAVGCQTAAEGKYHVRKIYKPMIYAKDIVHVLWQSKDVYLIANPNCQSAVFENGSGDVVSKTEFSPLEFPCVFLYEPPVTETKFNFYDSNGNIIQ